MEVHNVIEDFVKIEINKIFEDTEKYKGCTCESCKCDIAAIALNNLQPKYVTTEKGEVLGKIGMYDSQIQVNIISQVVKACEQVEKNSRHGQNQIVD